MLIFPFHLPASRIMPTLPNPPVTARIGLLVPSSNAVMEVDFYRSLPEDVTVHTSHIYAASQGVNADTLADMAAKAAQSARSMAQAELSLIVHGHTASSFIEGPEGDAFIAKSIGEGAGAPSMTTASAVVRCLKSIGARRIWLAAPYPVATTEMGADFFAASGFEIRAVECLGVTSALNLKKVTPQESYDLGLKAAAAGDADALVMSGTGVRTRTVVGPLERAIGKPVITANLAALWGALELLGMATRFAFGESRLLEWQRAHAARNP